MEKVITFLEKYAEWVALSLASLFLLYMVYENVVAPDHVRFKAGGDTVFPGEVDPQINRTAVTRLQQLMDAPAGEDLQRKLTVKEFEKDFRLAMSSKRARMAPEYIAGGHLAPPLPGGAAPEVGPGANQQLVTKLPVPPAPIWAELASGNSLVAPPQPIGAGGAAAAPAPAPVAIEANAIDKNWLFLEWKLPLAPLAAAWKQTFPNPQMIPAAAMETTFLELEVEREEMVGPNEWGNKVALAPLPLVEREEWPKLGDAQAEEAYRSWAEKNQPTIVNPPFYQIVKGDPWYIPSVGLPRDPAADQAAAQQPFDPANPPQDRELTSREKQLVYIYRMKQKEEEAKQKRQSRPSGVTPPRTGGTDDAGRRRIGGYAPLPEQYAAGAGLDVQPPANPAARRPSGGAGGGGGASGANPAVNGGDSTRPPGRYDDAGRPIGPTGRRPAADPTGRRPIGGDAGYPAAGQDQTVPANAILTGPWDPTKVAPDAQGKLPDLSLWAYDETAVPGKTYRYRMRVKLKNPIYHTFGLNNPANPQLAQQLAIESPFSAWKEITAPRTTEFFFIAKRAPIGGGKAVTHVTADVFKHERGKWTKETFVVAPGDSVGGATPRSEQDFSTGNTLVDVRWDTREKDVHILVADAGGVIENRSLDGDINDPLHKALQDKVKAGAAAAAAAAAANGGAEVTGALINEVGAAARRRE